MTKRSNYTKYFVLTLPLHCEPWQRDRLNTLFQVVYEMKQHLINYEKKRLKTLTSQKSYRKIQRQLAIAYTQTSISKEDEQVKREKIKKLGKQRTALLEAAGFSENAFQKQINKYRQHYKRKNSSVCLVNIHIAQKIASSVWTAFHAFFYGNGKEIHYSENFELTTISSKSTSTGIIYRGNGVIEINKMIIKATLDKKDRYGYQDEALKREVCFCSISRRWYASGWKYFLQLTLKGKPPIKVNPSTGEALYILGKGQVTHYLNSRTLASYSFKSTQLVELFRKESLLNIQIRKINFAMERSRKATNPEMFSSSGNLIPTRKLSENLLINRDTRLWHKSKRYLKLEDIQRELYRKQVELCEQQYRKIANQMLSFGDTHTLIDTRCYSQIKVRRNDQHKRSISIPNRKCTSFITILKRKVENAGGCFLTDLHTSRLQLPNRNLCKNRSIKRTGA